MVSSNEPQVAAPTIETMTIEAAEFVFGFGDDTGDLGVVEHVADDGGRIGAKSAVTKPATRSARSGDQIDQRDVAAGARQEQGGRLRPCPGRRR